MSRHNVNSVYNKYFNDYPESNQSQSYKISIHSVQINYTNWVIEFPDIIWEKLKNQDMKMDIILEDFAGNIASFDFTVKHASTSKRSKIAMGNETSNQDEEVRRNRVLFGSTPEPRTLRLETNSTQVSPDELSEHRESYSDEAGPTRKSELPYALVHTAVGLGIAAMGAVSLFLIYPAYARSDAAYLLKSWSLETRPADLGDLGDRLWLGLILEEETGKPYASLLQENVLNPLGLHGT